MVDVYNYIIRVVNILTFIYLLSKFSKVVQFAPYKRTLSSAQFKIIIIITDDIIDVIPFSDCYDAMCDVPIYEGSTYVQLLSGEKYIPQINLALCFGTHLKKSLLNPHPT